jgi:hypothetical protein
MDRSPIEDAYGYCGGKHLPHLGKPVSTKQDIRVERLSSFGYKSQIGAAILKYLLHTTPATRGYSCHFSVVLGGSTGGIPTRISTVSGFPSFIGGLNFHLPNANRAASSIVGTTP